MRVLHVAQPLDAGVPQVVGDLVDDQVRRGWQVAVAAPAAGDAARRAAAAGARHLAWEATRGPGPALARELAALRRIVATADPGLVHLHSAKAGLAGRLLLRGRRPTVFQPHAWSFEGVDGALRTAVVAWERAGARWTDLLVCVSEAERRAGERAGVRARAAVAPNGLDLGRFPAPGPGDRAAARAALGLGAGPLAVVVGRLAARHKGHDVLLDAWPRVRARVPGAELAVVGDGPDRAALEARGAEGVRFAGRQAAVRPWLLAADVVAVPSRYEAGPPLTLLEALACARSAVVTDVADMRTVVEPGAGAVVVLEPAALAIALAERLADPARAAAEGGTGRARVVERFDVRRTAARHAELYAALLDRRPAASSSTSASSAAHR